MKSYETDKLHKAIKKENKFFIISEGKNRRRLAVKKFYHVVTW